MQRALAVPRIIQVDSLPGSMNMHLKIERGADIMRQLRVQGVHIDDTSVQVRELSASTKVGSVSTSVEVRPRTPLPITSSPRRTLL